MFVIGKRDMQANSVSIRVHGKGDLGAEPRTEATAELLEAIKERCGRWASRMKLWKIEAFG